VRAYTVAYSTSVARGDRHRLAFFFRRQFQRYFHYFAIFISPHASSGFHTCLRHCYAFHSPPFRHFAAARRRCRYADAIFTRAQAAARGDFALRALYADAPADCGDAFITPMLMPPRHYLFCLLPCAKNAYVRGKCYAVVRRPPFAAAAHANFSVIARYCPLHYRAIFRPRARCHHAIALSTAADAAVPFAAAAIVVSKMDAVAIIDAFAVNFTRRPPRRAIKASKIRTTSPPPAAASSCRCQRHSHYTAGRSQ